MDVATLVTVVGTVVGTPAGVAGACYGWRAVAEARRERLVEEARRHAELEPRYRVKLEDMNSGAEHWHRLAVQLRGSRPVTGLQVTILEGAGASFTTNQWGVEAGKYPIRQAQLPDHELPLEPGRTACWRMEFDTPKATGTMTLRLDSRGTDDQGRAVNWTRVEDCRTPGPVLQHLVTTGPGPTPATLRPGYPRRGGVTSRSSVTSATACEPGRT